MKGKIYELNEEYCSEIDTIVSEIQERVNKLKQYAKSRATLNNKQQETVSLSKIRVTKSFRIYLTDYNNLEVELEPLQKALYILFLRHAEGISFKNLSEHKEELLQIYEEITCRFKDEKQQRSVNLLCNPVDNSVNEKCARIREFFVKSLDDSIAKNYYIIGERGGSKEILLPRDLVEFD